jgi:hypothetical protein
VKTMIIPFLFHFSRFFMRSGTITIFIPLPLPFSSEVERFALFHSSSLSFFIRSGMICPFSFLFSVLFHSKWNDLPFFIPLPCPFSFEVERFALFHSSSLNFFMRSGMITIFIPFYWLYLKFAPLGYCSCPQHGDMQKRARFLAPLLQILG